MTNQTSHDEIADNHLPGLFDTLTSFSDVLSADGIGPSACDEIDALIEVFKTKVQALRAEFQAASPPAN